MNFSTRMKVYIVPNKTADKKKEELHILALNAMLKRKWSPRCNSI